MICLHTYNYNQEAVIITKIANCQRHGKLIWIIILWSSTTSKRWEITPQRQWNRAGVELASWDLQQDKRYFWYRKEMNLFSGDLILSAISSSRTKVSKHLKTFIVCLFANNSHTPKPIWTNKKNQRLQVRSHQLLSPLYLWFQQFQSLRKNRISRSCRDQISLRVVGYHGDTRNPPSTKSWKLECKPINNHQNDWKKQMSRNDPGALQLISTVWFWIIIFSRDNRRKIMPGTSIVWINFLQGH